MVSDPHLYRGHRRPLRHTPAVSAAIMLVALLSACTSSASVAPGAPTATPPGASQGGTSAATSSTPASGGTLNVIEPGSIVNFDPASLYDADWPVNLALFDTLTREDAKLQPQPRLASSWNFAADFKTLTLTLRPNMKLSDGSPLDAALVAWNIQRYMDPATGANISGLLSTVAAVTAVDSATIQITFKQPAPTIFDALDLLFITGKGTPDAIKSTPIASGPYMLADYVPNDHATLKRNQGCPGGVR